MIALICLLGAASAASQEAPLLYLSPGFSTKVSSYAVPYAGFNGSQVLFSRGARIVGIDPKTSLIRWEGGRLAGLRSIWDMKDGILLVGEHVQAIDKGWGKEMWDFPLNCYSPDECNADILAFTPDSFLVGGFGKSYNMLQLVSLSDGVQVWPSWLSTPPFESVAVLDNSIFLLSKSPTALIQRIEIKTRRTSFSVPPPEKDFVPEQLRVSNRFVFVVGTAGEQRLLLVFSSEDGSLIRKVEMKSVAGSEFQPTSGASPSRQAGLAQGYLVAPKSGTFILWTRKERSLSLWGIDPESGKVSWRKQYRPGTMLGSVGQSALILYQDDRGWFLAGLTLASGTHAFEVPIPFKAPRAWISHTGLPPAPSSGPTSLISPVPSGVPPERVFAPPAGLEEPAFARTAVLVAGANEGVFLVASALSGAVTRVGRLPAAFPSEHDPLSFCEESGSFVLLGAGMVTQFNSSTLAEETKRLSALLDQGREVEAITLAQRILPFRKIASEAADAHREMLRLKWLQAGASLLAGDTATAVDLALAAMGEANETSDPRAWFPYLARFSSQCALSGHCPPGFMEAALDRVASLLFGLAEQPADELISDMLDLSILLAQTAVSAGSTGDPMAVIRELLSHQQVAARMEAHPFRALFVLKDVESLLKAASSALDIGDELLAASLLHDLASVSAATDIFGATYDPWLDAQGAYLLPEELLHERLPPIIKALKTKLAEEAKKREEASRFEVCTRSCRVTARYCPAPCASADACKKAFDKCRASCRKGTPIWEPPPFSTSPDAPDFLRCR